MFNDLFGKYFKFSLIVLVIADCFSYLAYQNFWWQLITFVLISLLVLWASLKKLEYGLYIVLAELFVGSQGHWFSLATPYFDYSIRMSIFLIVGLVWLSQLFKGGGKEFFSEENIFLYPYLILLIFLFLGTLNGLLNNQLKNVFLDVNGWLFFGLAPVFFSQIRSSVVIKKIFSILLAAAFFISLKTLAVLVIFAYPWPINISVFYTWLRDSRIGEITHVSGSYYRIFFQAQIYLLVSFLVSFIFLIFKDRLQLNAVTVKWLKWSAIVSSTAIIACLSRSFWLGLLFALLIGFILLMRQYKFKIAKIARLAAKVAVVAILEVGFLFIITGNLTNNWLKGRLDNPTTEAAGMSRLAQLGPLWQTTSQNFFIGSGFGQTVTYFSDDPRILAKAPSGRYTTFAFEWGYLDIWLKIGLLGLVSYLLLYYKIFRQGWMIIKSSSQWSIFVLALILGLIGIMLTSMFSPYLNHPLGIGYLLLTSAVISFFVNQHVNEPDKTSN